MTAPLSRRRTLAMTLAALAAGTGTRASAHEGDHLEAPVLFVLATRRSPDGRTVEVDLEIYNGFGIAATMRGMTASIGDRLSIERRRTLFGLEIWQPVSLLRLEPEEVVAIAPPAYRLRIQGVDAPLDERLRFQLTADFGPLGDLFTSTLTGPVRAPIPAQSDATGQITE